jgi:membrane-associated phospholipid phosphatase
MPSLHAMDAFIVGVVMFGLVRSPIAKALWLAWPVWVGFTVIATGNHYWLDVAAGVVLAIVAGYLLRGLHTLRVRHARA